MSVTIVLLTYNGERFLRQCLAHLLPLPDGFRLLIVDNGSRDRSVEIARQLGAGSDVLVLENGANFGFSGGMNRGIRLATAERKQEHGRRNNCEIVVLLNQDTQYLEGWHEQIVEPFDDPSVGAVGCKIYEPDRTTISHVGGRVVEPRCTTIHIGQGEQDRGQYQQLIDVPYATGAALALRVDMLHKVGLFDERFNPAYMEEVDLCERIWKAGYRVVVNPAARLIHEENSSTAERWMRDYLVARARLLLVIKRRPLTQLFGDFAQAEQAFLEQDEGLPDLRAFKRAYLDAILRLPDWSRAHEEATGEPVSTVDYERAVRLLASLRDLCIAIGRKRLTRLFPETSSSRATSKQ